MDAQRSRSRLYLNALWRQFNGGDFLPGNYVQLLESGGEYFPALLAAIDTAREEVHLETYLFADDATARSVLDALVRAVRRDVAVRVLVDGFGAREFPATLGRVLTEAGGEVLVYRPEIARFSLSRRRLRRLHRKLVVIDGQIGFAGGINIIDDYDMGQTPAQIPPRFDFAVRIEGPVVDAMHRSVRELWRRVRWAQFGRRPPPPSPLRYWGNAASRHLGREGIAARFVQRDSLRHRRAIEAAYLQAINAAQEEIILASAYFLPGRRLRQALEAAGRRGVRVTLLLQGRVEYALLHYATQGLYRLLMRAGVGIVEYRASFLHAKVAVVDGRWATVGSSNIDPFSLLLAREANVLVKDAGFAGELRQRLLHAIASGGVAVSMQDVRRWPWWRDLLARGAYGIARALARWSGARRRDEP